MPRVPTYERQQMPSIAQTPDYQSLVGFQNQLTGQLTNITKGMVGVDREIYKIVQRREAAKAEAEVQDLLNQAYSRDREYFGGLYKRKGKEALNVFGEGESYAKESSQDLISQLDTDEKRETFKRHYYPRVNAHLDRLFSHEYDQTEKYLSASRAGANIQDTNDAVMMRSDAVYVNDRMADIEGRIRKENAALEGPAVEVLVQDEKDKFYAQIMDGLYKDGVDRAQEFFDRHIDNEDPKKRRVSERTYLSFKEKLASLHVLKQEIDRADFIIAGETDHQKRLEMARESDTKIRDAVVARINRRNAEEKKFEADQREKRIYEYIDQMQAAGSLEKAMDIVRDVKAEDGKIQLLNTARGMYPTKRAEYDAELDLAIEEGINKGELTNPKDLLQFQGKIPENDFKRHAKNLQQGGYLGDVSVSKIASIYSNLTGAKAADDSAKFKIVRDAVYWNVSQGVKPTDANLDQIIGNAIMNFKEPGEYPGSWYHFGYGKNATYPEAVDAGKGAEWLPMVSDDENDEISAILRDAGRLVNEETIRLYKKHVILGIPRGQ